ncbi:hypothetical protein HMPREF3198_00314 [Winkia neuii]|nr:hypothetical protein HMPREF3198_00314 [Winkia neuii]
MALPAPVTSKKLPQQIAQDTASTLGLDGVWAAVKSSSGTALPPRYHIPHLRKDYLL